MASISDALAWPARTAGAAIKATPRAVLGACLVFFAAGPAYWLVTTATNPSRAIVTSHPILYPTFSELGGVTHSSEPIFTWFLNSTLVALGTVVVAVGLGVFAGYGLSRYRVRGSGLIGFLFFASQMMPAALLVVPLYGMFESWGLINTLTSVILAGAAFTMPVTVWVVKNAVDSLPMEIQEAARVDGASNLRTFRSVVFPLITPSVAAAAIISFFSGWNDFVLADTFLVSQSHWTATVGLASLFGQYTVPIDLIMASSLLFALPPVVFFLILQRRIVAGLTAGSVR
jgi:multiple sugar transport system permease protein